MIFPKIYYLVMKVIQLKVLASIGITMLGLLYYFAYYYIIF